MFKRIILVLLVTAMLVVTALPAATQDQEPRAPKCGWYYFDATRQYDAWWEYWCRWRGWGWEFVFWTWA